MNSPTGNQERSNREELALITGAGHRLGHEIALHLSKLGYAIAIHFNHSKCGAEETRKKIELEGGRAFVFGADLTAQEQIDHLFSNIQALNIPLRVLVNSAAVMIHGKLSELAFSEWNLMMDLNVRAVWWCSLLASKLMRDQGGIIINISDSGAGKLWIGYPVYSLSKAAVEMLTQLMAKTFAPSIRVNAVAPGLILPPDDFPREKWQKLIHSLPLKRAGKPGDVCAAVEYIIKNEYITGQTFRIDGGYQLV